MKFQVVSTLFIIGALILLPSSCKRQEVQFPTVIHMYDQVESSFKDLLREKDPESFHQQSQQIIDLIGQWEREILELAVDKDPLADDPVNRDWRQIVLNSYQLISDNHVQCYILRSEIMSPGYYEIQDSILADLDELALAMNRFMLQTYPIRELDMAFYKNVPEITSRTADPEGTMYYIIKVDMGYIREEKQTQTALNVSKIAMVDLIRSYCSNHTAHELLGWNEIDLKAGLIRELNNYLVQFYDFQPGKMEGVKIITFGKVDSFSFS